MTSPSGLSQTQRRSGGGELEEDMIMVMVMVMVMDTVMDTAVMDTVMATTTEMKTRSQINYM